MRTFQNIQLSRNILDTLYIKKVKLS